MTTQPLGAAARESTERAILYAQSQAARPIVGIVLAPPPPSPAAATRDGAEAAGNGEPPGPAPSGRYGSAGAGIGRGGGMGGSSGGGGRSDSDDRMPRVEPPPRSEIEALRRDVSDLRVALSEVRRDIKHQGTIADVVGLMGEQYDRRSEADWARFQQALGEQREAQKQERAEAREQQKQERAEAREERRELTARHEAMATRVNALEQSRAADGAKWALVAGLAATIGSLGVGLLLHFVH